MRVLGIEGTAWAASAAVFDVETDSVLIETEEYQPDSGGIHPREAAEHMHDAIPRVVERALERADDLDEVSEGGSSSQRAAPVDADEQSSSSQQAVPVDAVAFSRGPGLGPCLRIVATAARALAQTLDVPLVGVNHMVAHLEIGRHRSGFSAPVCLNASGANAHVLGHHDGRYRVLGETMDTGVGNAIDKFTRHVGWSHPGGPKVERAARDGEYVDLPYVVKGMDFSFSGIMSAAKQEYDDGTPVEDVCRGLQETVFAMLTEVAERALSLTGSDELVLGGGVGQNERLREMLATMCEQRGAEFHAPEPRFLRDNAGMIAVLGAKMLAAGDTVAVEDSRVDPDFRPDQVPVTWREREPWEGSAEGASGQGPRADESVAPPGDRAEIVGAEARVTVETDRVVKRRVPKAYRHPALDERLRRERTVSEARLTSAARRHGVPTPVVLDLDVADGVVVFERVGATDLQAALSADRVRAVGRHLATVHDAGFVHGDPTTRNVRVGRRDPSSAGDDDASPDRDGDGSPDGNGDGSPDGDDDLDESADDPVYLIDFGLGYHTDDREDYAMDLHVLAQSLAGTADDPAAMREAAEAGYREVGDDAVVDRLREIESRGRYR